MQIPEIFTDFNLWMHKKGLIVPIENLIGWNLINQGEKKESLTWARN